MHPQQFSVSNSCASWKSERALRGTNTKKSPPFIRGRDHPGDRLVEQKKYVDGQAAAIAEELGGNQVMRMISEEDTRALLGNSALQSLDRHVKAPSTRSAILP